MRFPSNSLSSSRSEARADGSLPTSKVCQVPTPMIGKGSPVDGMRFVMMPPCAADGLSAPAATRARSAIGRIRKSRRAARVRSNARICEFDVIDQPVAVNLLHHNNCFPGSSSRFFPAKRHINARGSFRRLCAGDRKRIRIFLRIGEWITVDQRRLIRILGNCNKSSNKKSDRKSRFSKR